MTEVLTSAEMRALEARAMDSGQVTGLELMERAGRCVVDAIQAEFQSLGPGSGVTVLCGPGNNGGDGFVIARLLRELGMRVRVLAVPTLKRGVDATTVRRRLACAGVRVVPLTYDAVRWGVPDRVARTKADADRYSDLYVDALFGIGLTRPAKGELEQIIRHMAGSGGDHGFYQPRLVSVDVPSGLCADSGRVPGCAAPDPFKSLALYAALTVTFDSPKPGHFLGHGPSHCGKLVVADIGLRSFREAQAHKNKGGRAVCPVKARLVPSLADVSDSRTMKLGSVSAYLQKRQGHKYDHGHALVLTGGPGQGGAARLAARGALRIGAGAVTLACPPDALAENASRVDAVMTRVVAGPEDLSVLLSDKRFTCVIAGPGLGVDRAAQVLPVLLSQTTLKLVLDADALTALAQDDALRARLHENVLLTPHMGEFARLAPDLAALATGPKAPDGVRYQDFEAVTAQLKQAQAYQTDMANQTGPLPSTLDVTRTAAQRFGCTVLLKGAVTGIARPDGRATLHSAAYDRAVPWLATAGAGDVLAGFAGGLMARGLSTDTAAGLAAELHVDCARAFGPGLIAEDLPEQLPAVLRARGV